MVVPAARWAVPAESGTPTTWELLLTIKGSLLWNSFPWLSFSWTSCYLTVGLIFFPCKIESKRFPWFVGLGAFVNGPCLLFFVHDMKCWHVEFTTKKKRNLTMSGFCVFLHECSFLRYLRKLFSLSFSFKWGSSDLVEMVCDN